MDLCGGWESTKDGHKCGMVGTTTLIILISMCHYLVKRVIQEFKFS